MKRHYVPLIALPEELSDKAAAQLLAFLYDITRALENHYATELHRYHHALDERQHDLWAEQDPPR